MVWIRCSACAWHKALGFSILWFLPAVLGWKVAKHLIWALLRGGCCASKTCQWCKSTVRQKEGAWPWQEAVWDPCSAAGRLLQGAQQAGSSGLFPGSVCCPGWLSCRSDCVHHKYPWWCRDKASELLKLLESPQWCTEIQSQPGIKSSQWHRSKDTALITSLGHRHH